jgi:flavin-binding protein dodecin
LRPAPDAASLIQAASPDPRYGSPEGLRRVVVGRYNAERHRLRCRSKQGGDEVAKKQTDSVYRIVDVVGVSEKSWEDAGRRAVETAAGSLRDLRVAEVVKMDMKVEDGKVTAFRTRVALSFKYEA